MKKIALILGMVLAAPPSFATDITWPDKVTGNTFTAADANAVKTAVNSKADKTNITFVAGALSDMKILDTAQPANGTALVLDTAAYGDTDDQLHLWSIDKVGSLLAGKQATLGANAYQAYDTNMITWPIAISATEVGYLDGLTGAISTSLSGKQSVTGASYPATTSTTAGTIDINIDGASTDHYYWNNGVSAAAYRPVITSPPATGYERGIVLTVGGGSVAATMTWTNVSFLGTAGAATTTANKYSHYACFIRSTGNALCKIIAEAANY